MDGPQIILTEMLDLNGWRNEKGPPNRCRCAVPGNRGSTRCRLDPMRSMSGWQRIGVVASVLICWALLPATSARPQDMRNSFVEFKDKQQTTTFDLRTVEVIQPGKFIIVETVLDHPDVMTFKLKVLDTLRSHCDRPVGSYPAPAEVFTLGPADMPVKEIEVEQFDRPTAHFNFHYKVASWWLPYRKTMVGTGAGYKLYRCKQPDHSETEEYRDARNVILNGLEYKVLVDCNRGLWGDFFGELDGNDYRKVQLYPVDNGTVRATYYKAVCRALTRKDPYISE